MTAIRIMLALGLLAACSGVVLLVLAPDMLYLLAAIAFLIVGAGLLATGGDRYERLTPAKRRPIVGPRLSATVLIISGTALAAFGILTVWDLAASGSDGEPRAWRLPSGLLTAALLLFLTAWHRLRRASCAGRGSVRGNSSSAVKSADVASAFGESHAAQAFARRASPKQDVILPPIPPESIEQWAPARPRPEPDNPGRTPKPPPHL
jgi:hypothetical protein